MDIASRALIEEAVSLIENSVREPLSLDDVSGHLHVSKYHMHRLFKALTGQPLMTYVRGRRLSASVTELLETDHNIINIAEEFQFDYEQSYERAFKRLFGMTPGELRRRRCEIPVVHKIDCGLIYDLPQGVLLSPRYCIVPEFHVAGVEELINHAENREKGTANTLALDFYETLREKVPYRVNETVYYGLISYSENPAAANHYMPCIEIASKQKSPKQMLEEQNLAGRKLPEPLQCRSIPTNTYAVFRYVGFHDPRMLSMQNLGSLYEVIDTLWYPSTQLKPAAPYHFERMDLAKCSSTYCEAEIYLPVISSR